MSTEMSCHFIHLLQVSKNSLKSDFMRFFSPHDLMYVYSPGAGQIDPGDKILMSTERSYHFIDLLQINHWSRTNGLVANKIHEFMIIKNLLQIDLHVHKFSEAY